MCVFRLSLAGVCDGQLGGLKNDLDMFMCVTTNE